MAPRKRPIAVIALIVFLGIVVGTVVGDMIGLLLPEEMALRKVFLNATELQLGPVHLNMVVFSFTFGFSLRVNLISVLGIFVVLLLLRLYW